MAAVALARLREDRLVDVNFGCQIYLANDIFLFGLVFTASDFAEQDYDGRPRVVSVYPSGRGT